MKIGRGWWALAGVVAASVLLLLAGYAGAYYWLVFPLRDVYRVEPFYRVSLEHSASAEAFFKPMHRVDCWLRPATWKAPSPVSRGLVSEWGDPVLEPAPAGSPP